MVESSTSLEGLLGSCASVYFASTLLFTLNTSYGAGVYSQRTRNMKHLSLFLWPALVSCVCYGRAISVYEAMFHLTMSPH
jgi:cell division protein FtsX